MKDRLIKWLGGYTKDEQLCRPIKFIRQEVPIQTLRAEFIVGQDNVDPETVLKHKIVDAIVNADPSPITFRCESYTSYGHNVYSAELKVCMPMEDR